MPQTHNGGMNEEIRALEEQMVGLAQQLFDARAKAPAEPVADYEFQTENGPISLRSLFGDKRALIVIHNMGKSCSYCTLWADNLQGTKSALETEAALVVSSPDDPKTQREIAEERGWTTRMVSDATGEFTRAMGFLMEADGWGPGVSTFRLTEEGKMVRTGRTEFGPGDAFCPTWHFFSMLGISEESWTPR